MRKIKTCYGLGMDASPSLIDIEFEKLYWDIKELRKWNHRQKG